MDMDEAFAILESTPIVHAIGHRGNASPLNYLTKSRVSLSHGPLQTRETGQS